MGSDRQAHFEVESQQFRPLFAASQRPLRVPRNDIRLNQDAVGLLANQTNSHDVSAEICNGDAMTVDDFYIEVPPI